MTPNSSLTDEDKRYHRLIPRLFVAFFAVIVLVNGVFLYFAQRTHTGVVRSDAYEVGLAYNRVVAQSDAQAALGWQANARMEGQAVTLMLSDRSGRPLSGALVSARLRRPVTNGMDFQATLTESRPGQYVWQPATTWPASGQWDAIVDVTWQQQTYQLKSRLMVP